MYERARGIGQHRVYSDMLPREKYYLACWFLMSDRLIIQENKNYPMRCELTVTDHGPWHDKMHTT
jgi:hypothetical protein